MSISLETVLLLMGPALAVCVLMLVATMWRRSLVKFRKTIERLEELNERINALQRPEQCSRVAPTSGRLTSESFPRPTRRVDSPQRADSKDHAPLEHLLSVPNLAVGLESQVSPESDLNRRYAAIWDLAEAGASAETIARKTSQPLGQVELILGLKRQTDATISGLK